MEKVLKVALMLSAIDKMSSTVNKASNESIKSLTRVQKEADRMSQSAFSFGRKTGALGLAVGAPLIGMTLAAEKNATAQARLEQVFRSMGETTGVAANEAKRFADNLQFQIAVDDGSIMEVQAKLATFNNVIRNTEGTSEVFERATKAAFDLQAAGFGQGTENAVQLGKALNDPIKGMTALSRSGVTFTAVEQQKIKSLVESGQQLEAQRLMLEAVEKQVGGVAAATADDSAKIRVAFQKVTETLGAALLPVLKDVADFVVNRVVPAVKNLVENHGPLLKIVMLVAAGFAALMTVLSIGSFVFGGLLKVVSMGVGVFKLLAGAIGFVGTVIKTVTAFMLANPIILIITAIAGAAYLIYEFWEPISGFFSGLWDGIKDIFSGFYEWAKTLFLNFTPMGLIIKHWDDLPGWFSGMWESVKGIFTGFWDWVTGFGSRMFDAGMNIVNSIWDGMKSIWNSLVGWFEDGIQMIRDFLPFSPAKRGPLTDIHRLKLVETIAENIKPGPLENAMETATQGVRAQAGNLGAGGGGLAMAGAGGGGVVVNFAPKVTVGAGGSPDDFMQMLRDFQPELIRAVEEAMARKNRTKF